MQFFNKANSFIEKWMQLIMPLCVVVGFFWGKYIAFLKPATNWLFAFACFASSLTLSLSECRKAFNIKAILLLLLLGHVVIPFAAWAVFRIFEDPSSDFFMGLILIFAGPCATTSFIWSGIYGGNKGLSIVFVVIDTMLSILLTPLIIRITCATAVRIDSLGLIWSMTKMVIFPSVAGVLVVSRIKQEKLAVAAPPIKFITKISLLLIIIISLSGSTASVKENFSFGFIWSFFGVLIVLVFGYLFGFFASRFLLKSDTHDAVSMSFALGCRNLGLSIILASSYFPPLAAVPPVITLFFHDIVTTSAGRVFLKLNEKDKQKKESINAASCNSQVQ